MKNISIYVLVVSILSIGLIYWTKQDYKATESPFKSFDKLYIDSNKTNRIGDFSLKNQHNQVVDSQLFTNHWTLVFFGFTRCGQVCPTTLAKLNAAYKVLNEHNFGAKLQVVFISLDPIHDSPEKIGSYLGQFNSEFIGLTGTQDEIKAIGKFFSADGPNYEEHSTALFMVAPDRSYRGHFVRVSDPASMAKILNQVVADAKI